MNKAKIGARIEVEVKKRPLIRSIWDVECHSANGEEKWKVHKENIVTDEGLAALLDIMFMGGTQITDWFVALIEDGDSETSDSTYAVPIYTECTAISELTRPAYTGVQTDAEITNNASKAVFTMTGTKDLLGGALVGGGTDDDTLGDTAGGGTLYCAIDFDESKSVVSTDIVSITIVLTAVDVT